MSDSLTADERTSWIELEDTFLTDTPRGTDKPPTEAWLFTWQCKRLKRGVRRKRFLTTIKCEGQDDLDKKLEAFTARPDVKLIEDRKS